MKYAETTMGRAGDGAGEPVGEGDVGGLGAGDAVEGGDGEAAGPSPVRDNPQPDSARRATTIASVRIICRLLLMVGSRPARV